MKRILGATLSLILALTAISALSYFKIREKIDTPLNPSSTAVVAFEIVKGQGVEEIGKNLEKASLITGSDFFKLYLWENGLGSKLKAGAYELSAAMSIAQIVDLFTGGESGMKSNEAKISVKEGSSNAEILSKLKESGVVQEDASFENADMDFTKYDFLKDKPKNADMQGFLFPDTYNFFKGSSMQTVTEKMLGNFDKKFTPQMREDIREQDKSTYDIIIMASIIEKEAANKEEMPTIASVFYNRLRIGQALQSDATINYITGSGRAMSTGEDLSIDSPYNTYKYTGLTPTPICNPGIEAIKAAIYPGKTDYFYFLTTQDEQRTTYFSKTYEEHLRYKAMHLK